MNLALEVRKQFDRPLQQLPLRGAQVVHLFIELIGLTLPLLLEEHDRLDHEHPGGLAESTLAFEGGSDRFAVF